jgi:hypothetical protein
MAIALDMQKGISHENNNIIEFPIVDVASAIGWDSGVVKSHLKNLEWTTRGENFQMSLHVIFDIFRKHFIYYTMKTFHR